MAEATRAEALEEAYNRGILPAEMAAAYEQAMERGLLPSTAKPIILPNRQVLINLTDYERPLVLDVPAPGAEIAAQGIDVTTGAPAGRISSSFAENEAFEVENLTKRLSDHYGEEVNVTMSEFGLEFTNPKTGHRTLVDESAASLQDIGDVLGASITIAGAVGGGIAGMFGGIPNIGAGIGAAIGEVIKRGIGHLLGVREATLGEEVVGTIAVGATEAAAGKSFELVIKGLQRVRNFFKPRVISADKAESLSVAALQNQAIADEIAKRSGKEFQPFTGQLTDDTTLLGHQAAARNNPETAQAFREQEVRNETALESFWDKLNPAPTAPATAVGRSVQLEARDQTRGRVEAARDTTDQAIDDLETLTRELPKGENSAIVNEATAAAAAARKVVKGAEDDSWDAYKLAIGLNEDTALSQIRVPVEGELAIIMRRLRAEAEQAIDPEDATALFRLQPEAFSDGSVDLWQLQRYLGSLKRRLRLASAGKVATDPSGRDIERVMVSVQKQRDAFLKKNHPEILEQVLHAEELTLARATTFDKGIVSQLLRREGGEWTLTDAQLIGGVLGSGDREAMEHIVAAFSKHPAGVPALQSAFLKYYRNEVVEGGIPKGTLHRRFMDKHGETIDVLFGGDKRLLRLGNFEKAVTKRIARFERFEKAVQKSFRGKIQDISPEKIVTKIFTDRFDIKEVSHLMRLAEAAGYGAIYKDAIRGQIRNRFYSPYSGIAIKPLDTFLIANREKLIATLGGRYVRDMGLLLDGIKIARTTTSGIATTRAPGLLATIAEGFARATVARPLSPHGVALTKTIGFHERAKARAWAAIVEDPKLLRAIIANKNADVTQQAAARILGLITGGYFISNPPEFDTGALTEELYK